MIEVLVMVEKVKKKNTSNDKLRIAIATVVTIAWFLAVMVGLFFPERQIDPGITTVMMAVVGAVIADKVVSEFKK